MCKKLGKHHLNVHICATSHNIKWVRFVNLVVGLRCMQTVPQQILLVITIAVPWTKSTSSHVPYNAWMCYRMNEFSVNAKEQLLK